MPQENLYSEFVNASQMPSRGLPQLDMQATKPGKLTSLLNNGAVGNEAGYHHNLLHSRRKPGPIRLGPGYKEGGIPQVYRPWDVTRPRDRWSGVRQVPLNTQQIPSDRRAPSFWILAKRISDRRDPTHPHRREYPGVLGHL